ncbi:GNAT family N-acetyltransferase [Alkalihalobacillus macyae]|uniref:GNAT family N-acetyltransferase n=1 Tax=Guptibacillus hwajinpoensis TaxID=208199 RepID=UPI00273A9041|nr:GNAT family N-acetyltransferase [Alkalihalobacillus macyae]MDP4549309.1 GNAT family N-acetyltransferase [Alkalihalobacillus macyae]
MIQTLHHQNAETAKLILDVQLPAYRKEAEIINFEGIPQLSDTVTSIQTSEETFIGCFREGKVAGVLSFEHVDGTIRICRLVVHPRYFRMGIAKEIMEHLFVANNKDFVVSTGADNMPAVKFYKKFGFHEVERSEPVKGVYLTHLKKEAKNG